MAKLNDDLDESLLCGNRLAPKHQGENQLLMRKFKHWKIKDTLSAAV